MNDAAIKLVTAISVVLIIGSVALIISDAEDIDGATYSQSYTYDLGESVSSSYMFADQSYLPTIEGSVPGLTFTASRGGQGLTQGVVSWSGTPTAIGTYTVTATGTNGSVATLTFTIVTEESESYNYETGQSVSGSYMFPGPTYSNPSISGTVPGLTFTAGRGGQGSSQGTVSWSGTPTTEGHFTVTATSNGSKVTLTFNIEAGTTPVSSISITGSSSGEVGDIITLTATSSPTSADDRGVTFSITSGSSRATITSQSETSTGGRCTIELESAGSITVTATASDGSGVTRTKTITIYEPEVLVTSVSISGSSTVQVGSTLTLTATTSPSNADDRTVNWSITSGTSHVSYTTSDTSTGGRIVLTGLSAGTATVRATAADGSGEYATKTITVQAADVEITSSQGNTTISTGTAFSYVVNTNVSGCTISVSGADWLHVSGNTVYGTPTEAGEFDITITASRSGYTSDTQSFTITVVSSLSFTSAPSTGLIVVEV